MPPEEEPEAEALVPRLGQPSTTAPEPSSPDPAGTEPTQSTDAGFQVRFVAADENVSSLKVKCHKGTPKGTGPVTVEGASVGPCRVQGITPSGTLVAFYTPQGPGTVTCFADGERSCQ
jgi:hypothetical protein